MLQLKLEGFFTEDEMRKFAAEHNAAVDSFGDSDYHVFVDIRALRTLSPVCAEMMEKCKVYSSSHLNFQGSAVLVASAITAMQHQRTSVAGGVIDSELISENEQACWEHIARVRRMRMR